MRVPALAKPPKANGPQRHPRVQQWFGTVCSASWSLHTVAVTVCSVHACCAAQPTRPTVSRYICSCCAAWDAGTRTKHPSVNA
jgi:hypothetical protein